MPIDTATPLDDRPLIGSPDRPDIPSWAPQGLDRRTTVAVQLPTVLVDRLLELQDDLDIAASDLVAAYLRRGAAVAAERRARFLVDLDSPTRIKGWMDDGTPILAVGVDR